MNRLRLSFSYLCLILLPAFIQQEQNFDEMVDNLIARSVPLIYADSLNGLLTSNSKVVLFDAREMSEYKVSHLPKAKYVGYEKFNLNELKIPKDAEIVVYCSVGYRSEKIGEQLQKAGFVHVHNLHGGIFGWKNKNYVVVDSQNRQTERIHAYSETWGKWLVKGEKIYD